MKPLLILSRFIGTSDNAGVTSQVCPTLGTPEGIGSEATSDFVPFYGDPQEPKGYVVI